MNRPCEALSGTINFQASVHTLDRLYICIMLFLLGARLLDKNGFLSPIAHRISYGDILFLIYMVFGFAININWLSRFFAVSSRTESMFIICVFAFALWTGLSWSVNTMFLGGNVLDFFGIPVRVAYYGVLSLFVSKWVRKYDVNILVLPFCIGILFMFYCNFLTSAIVISNIPTEINEKNFSGVLLPICSLYFVLSLLWKPRFFTMLLLFFTYASSLLVYSLGAIILMILAIPAVWMSVRNFFLSRRIYIHKRVLSFITLLAIFVIITSLITPYINSIIDRVSGKLHNIPGVSKDIESTHYRLGHFVSSAVISAKNPLFGVGEYNWENENDKNRDWLGKWYMKNDNPHNAVAQIMSMFGAPAILLFGLCFYFAFKGFYKLRLLKGMKWSLLVFSVACVFVVSANVMDAIFTTYYFYFFVALIFGIGDRIRLMQVVPSR